MTPKEFDDFVGECWMGGVQPVEEQVIITALGLSGETAEVMEKILSQAAATVVVGNHAERIKKITRGDDPKPHHRTAVAHELGDILFYVSNQARLHGFTLTDIMSFNEQKLSGRLKRLGTLRGDGDAR